MENLIDVIQVAVMALLAIAGAFFPKQLKKLKEGVAKVDEFGAKLDSTANKVAFAIDKVTDPVSLLKKAMEDGKVSREEIEGIVAAANDAGGAIKDIKFEKVVG